MVLALVACGRELNYINPLPNAKFSAGAFSIADLQAQNLPPVQTFTINMANSQQLTCSGGTQLMIEPGSLMVDGKPATSGTVQIQVRELQQPSKIILTGITTQTDNGMLESAGMIELEANIPDAPAKRVDVNPTQPVYMAVPASSKPGASTSGFGSFYFNPSNQTWTAGTDTANRIWRNNQWMFNMPVRKKGWINCDRFYHQKPCSDIRVVLPDTFMGCTDVFVVVHKLRSAIRLYLDTSKREFNVKSRGYDGFPDTLLVTAICHGVKNGLFYEYDTTFNVAPGLKFHMKPVMKNRKEHEKWLATIFDEE
ncbi:MAG: hypothetical protein JNL57_12430 [Bacteroidetes bacterium]|nr:hypothetical protein [Bacteroidota bacterium]